jgi:hypothetical protein
MSPRVLWGARFVLFATAIGVALLGIAMWLYPGGTALDADAPGHSFWLNFLCDLTEPVARNGVPNRLGAQVARVAMLDLAVALGAVWLVGPAFVEERAPGSARTIRVAGATCAAALCAVPFTERTAHMIAIFTAASAGLTAGVVTIVAHVRTGGPRRRWMLLTAVLVATAADSVFYAQSMSSHPRVVRPELPVVQRVGSLLALAWMVATALDTLRAGARARRGAAAPPEARS